MTLAHGPVGDPQRLKRIETGGNQRKHSMNSLPGSELVCHGPPSRGPGAATVGNRVVRALAVRLRAEAMLVCRRSR